MRAGACYGQRARPAVLSTRFVAGHCPATGRAIPSHARACYGADMRDSRSAGVPPHTASASRAALIIAIAVAVGCGASGIAVQARIADTIGRSVNAASVPLTDAYEAAQRSALDEHCPSRERCDGPGARVAVDAVRSRWGIVRAAHDSLRLIHDTWAGQIETCARAQSRDACTPQVLQMAGRVVEVATTWRCALRAVGVSDPIPLPLTCPQNDGGPQ